MARVFCVGYGQEALSVSGPSCGGGFYFPNIDQILYVKFSEDSMS